MTPEYSDAALVQPSPPPTRLTLKNLNRLNKRFWRKECKSRDRRISDPAIYASAIASMDSEYVRGIPLKNRMTLELALARAEEDKIRFQQAEPEREAAERAALSAFSQKGGKAPRENALNGLIQKLAPKVPKITVRQLLRQLELQVGQGTIVSIESESQVLEGDVRKIHYVDKDGKPKTASVAGLKDRLARVKQKINSR
jgi:hypothetical protein